MQRINTEVYILKLSGETNAITVIYRLDENNELHSFDCKPALTIIHWDSYYKRPKILDFDPADVNRYNIIRDLNMKFYNKGKLLYSSNYNSCDNSSVIEYNCEYTDKSDIIKYFICKNGKKEVYENGTLIDFNFEIPDIIKDYILFLDNLNRENQ